ncbi:hypothetical protein Tco_1271888, partial [Tanacetum coccineum]
VIYDKEKPGSRKAHLLEDKHIPSVGVFDEHLDEGIQCVDTTSQNLVTASKCSSNDVRILVMVSEVAQYVETASQNLRMASKCSSDDVRDSGDEVRCGRREE